HRAARRRRHGRERLDDAAPGRSARRAGGPAGGARDHRAGRRLAGGHAGRRVAGRGGLRQGLAARAALRGGNAGGAARSRRRGLAGGNPEDAGSNTLIHGNHTTGTEDDMGKMMTVERATEFGSAWNSGDPDLVASYFAGDG